MRLRVGWVAVYYTCASCAKQPPKTVSIKPNVFAYIQKNKNATGRHTTKVFFVTLCLYSKQILLSRLLIYIDRIYKVFLSISGPYCEIYRSYFKNLRDNPRINLKISD